MSILERSDENGDAVTALNEIKINLQKSGKTAILLNHFYSAFRIPNRYKSVVPMEI